MVSDGNTCFFFKVSSKRKYTNSLINITFDSVKSLCSPKFVFTKLGPDTVLSLNANFVVYIKQDGNFFKLSISELSSIELNDSGHARSDVIS